MTFVRSTLVAALAVARLATVAFATEHPIAETDTEGNSSGSVLFCDPVPVGAQAARGGLAGGAAASFLVLDGDPEGDMPREVAITPDGTLAVVVNRDTDLMVFVDLESVEIVASVPVGDFPVDVAISGDGRYALSANVFSNSVTVVDIATKTVAAEIEVSGEQPYRIEATADGSTAVVGVINDGTASSFSVLDLDALSESSFFPSTPQGVFGFFFTPAFAIGGNIFTTFALTPDGTTIVLPWRGGAQVTLYDIATGGAVAEIPVEPSPSGVDIAADGSIAAILHDGAASAISTIDLATGSVVNAVPVGVSLQALTVRLTPDADFAMAASGNDVYFIDLASGATSSISTGVVGEIEISADGQYAFVSNFNARVIDLATQSLVATIPFGACVEAATSPVANVAVALNNRFREEIYVYDIDGAAASFRGFVRSGPDPEADAPKELALSPDGQTALVANAVSRNVSFVDLASGTVIGVVDTGDVPRESAFTPDGAYALVCNGDSDTLSIIEMASLTVVATLPTTQRPTRVRVSADGSEAYVCTIAGSDTLYFIDLDGANSSIVQSFPIGQMGAANGYPYSEVSGMELSPDGSQLVLTISFDDILRVVDTATRQVVDDVAVGDFPIRAAFDPAGDRIFVANAFGDSISIVRFDGGVWFQDAVVGGIDFPLDMALDSDGQHLYVGRCGFQAPAVVVIDLDAAAIVKTIPLPGIPREGEYLAASDQYLVTTDNGSLMVIDAAGADAAIVDEIPISGSAPDFRYSVPLALGLASSPGVPDGLDLVSFGAPSIPGDLDGDGDVDGADLGLLLAAWGGRGPADLDGNGIVDGADLGILLASWG
ncbi:MAG: hypothetical protein KDA22_07345 [Phycisphaerales bacterium]|nr:hypothetical protein [Phycisphaerales bacterium]